MLHELMTGQRRVHEIDFENDKKEFFDDLSHEKRKATDPKVGYNNILKAELKSE